MEVEDVSRAGSASRSLYLVASVQPVGGQYEFGAECAELVAPYLFLFDNLSLGILQCQFKHFVFGNQHAVIGLLPIAYTFYIYGLSGSEVCSVREEVGD